MIDKRWSQVKRVLAIRLDNLGDVLVTTPALHAIKTSLPAATLTLLTSPVGAQVARLNPDLDDVIVYQAPWMDPWHKLPQDSQREQQMIATIRERRFDGAIIFTSFRQSPLPAAYLCYLADIPLRVAASIDGPGSLLTTRHKHPPITSDKGGVASQLPQGGIAEREQLHKNAETWRNAFQVTDNKSDLCATLFELGNIAAQRGELLQALELYEEAARTAEAAHVYYFLALAHNNFAYHSLLLGHLKAAQRALARGNKLAETYEMFGALLHLASTQGEIHLYLGEWAEAAEAFQHGLALAEDLGNLERQAGYRAGLALAARGQGNLASAITLLEEALTLVNERGYWHLSLRIQLWLAETLLTRGLPEAEAYLDAALATAQQQGRTLLLMQGSRLNARLLAVNGDWPKANDLFALVLEQATGLDLPLEIARTQAAWGESLLRYASQPNNGRALLAQAREVFTEYDAVAELKALMDTTR